MKLFYGSKFGNKSIEISQYNTAQEKQLLLLGLVQISDVEFNQLDEALKIIGYSEELISSMKRIEKLIVLMKCREMSVDDFIAMNFPCNNCNNVNPIAPKISQMYHNTKVEEEFKIDKYTIKESFENAYFNKDKISSYIYIDDNPITEEELDNMDSSLYEEIYETIMTHSMKFNERIDVKCQCGHEQYIELTDDFIVNNMSEDSIRSLYQTYTDLIFFGKYSKQDVDTLVPFERSILVNFVEQAREKITQ